MDAQLSRADLESVDMSKTGSDSTCFTEQRSCEELVPKFTRCKSRDSIHSVEGRAVCFDSAVQTTGSYTPNLTPGQRALAYLTLLGMWEGWNCLVDFSVANINEARDVKMDRSTTQAVKALFNTCLVVFGLCGGLLIEYLTQRSFVKAQRASSSESRSVSSDSQSANDACFDVEAQEFEMNTHASPMTRRLCAIFLTLAAVAVWELVSNAVHIMADDSDLTAFLTMFGGFVFLMFIDLIYENKTKRFVLTNNMLI